MDKWIKALRYCVPLILLGGFFMLHRVQAQWEARLRKVLSDIQENSIRSLDWTSAEWQAYHNKQLQRLPITTRSSFYDAVEDALADLQDHHSFLMRQCRKEDTTSSETPTDEYREFEYTIRAEHGIGYIKFPINLAVLPVAGNITSTDAILYESWTAAFANELERVASHVTKGWIIDLTGNGGGNMYPMLAALSSFFRDTPLGGFYCNAHNETVRQQILIFDGQAFVLNGEPIASYQKRVTLYHNKLPLVVLVGPKTASSGEFVALAFQRQGHIIMGQPTAGLATGNAPVELPDHLGCYMLTVCYYLDKDNQPLRSQRISPNVVVEGDRNILEEQAQAFLEGRLQA